MAIIDEGIWQNIISIETGSGGFFVAGIVTTTTGFPDFIEKVYLQVTRFNATTGSQSIVYSREAALNDTSDGISIFPFMSTNGMERVGESIYILLTDLVTSPATFKNYLLKVSTLGSLQSSIEISGAEPDEIGRGTVWESGAKQERLYVTQGSSLLTFDTDLGAVTPDDPLTGSPGTLSPITSYHASVPAEGNGARFFKLDVPSGWVSAKGTAGWADYSGDAAFNLPITAAGGQLVAVNLGGGKARAWDVLSGVQILDATETFPLEYGSNSGDGRSAVRVTGAKAASMFYTGEVAAGKVERYDGASQIWSVSMTVGSFGPSPTFGAIRFVAHTVVPSGD